MNPFKSGMRAYDTVGALIIRIGLVYWTIIIIRNPPKNIIGDCLGVYINPTLRSACESADTSEGIGLLAEVPLCVRIERRSA